MKEINCQEALRILSQSGSEFIIASDSLNYLIKNEEPVVCYKDPACIVFINKRHHADYITVVPMAHTLDSEALLSILNKSRINSSVLIDTQKLSAKFSDSLDFALNSFFKHERTLEDFMYPSEKPVDGVFENIRLLDSADRDSFIALSSEIIMNRPPLPVLFDVFVKKEQGFIFGAFDGDHIVGYLSFFQILPEVFDVDYIYVKPEKRALGVGKSLGNMYAKYARDRNHIAYWSNAQNDASKLTALSCGFQFIRQAKKYIRGA